MLVTNNVKDLKGNGVDDNFIAIRGMYIYLCDQSVLVNKVFLFLQTKEHSSFKILINVINSLKC